MDERAKCIVLAAIEPILEAFSKKRAEHCAKGVSDDAYFVAMLAYLEVNTAFPDDEAREVIMGALREAAGLAQEAPKKVE
jgi:hypothetical protein